MLNGSGQNRYKFAIYHNIGDQFVYVVGGKDGNTLENSAVVQKFDIIKQEWLTLPSMNNTR